MFEDKMMYHADSDHLTPEGHQAVADHYLKAWSALPPPTLRERIARCLRRLAERVEGR